MSSDSSLQQYEHWSSGEGYEMYVGRWSRLVARQFIAWLAMPAAKSWLDVGCGTGPLVEALLDQAQPSYVAGIDSSEAYVAHAEAKVRDSRASFRVADAQELPFADREFDAVVSGLVLNFVPNKEGMVAEMRRVARPAGQVAAYVWDYGSGMQMIRRFWDAAALLDAAAAALDQANRFPVAHPERLTELFIQAGLVDVTVRAIEVPTTFRDFDDYWSPFLTGQGAAPTYCMSLPEGKRAELRERLRSALPFEADGSIRLNARAWAVKGKAA